MVLQGTVSPMDTMLKNPGLVIHRVKDNLEHLCNNVFGEYWSGTVIEIQPLLDTLDKAVVARGSLAEPSSFNEGEASRSKEAFLNLQAKFFEGLDLQLRRVSRIYHKSATAIKDSDDAGRFFGRKNMRFIPRSFTSMRVGRGFKVAATVNNIYIQSVICTHYAQIHREALRALTQLHDELIGGNKGAQYLDMVWAAGDDRGLFLHSALLRELEALQELMTRKLGTKICEALNPTWQANGTAVDQDAPMMLSFTAVMAAKELNAADRSGANATDPKAQEPQQDAAEEDDVPPQLVPLLTCPVCLEYMYRPHGLSCGHCMCTTCLLSANGLIRSVAPSLKALMSHLPYKKGRCPICRQLINGRPMELTALGRLVNRAAPNYYKKCDKDFKRKQKELKAKLEKQIAVEVGLDSNPLFPVLQTVPELFSFSNRNSTAPRARSASSGTSVAPQTALEAPAAS